MSEELHVTEPNLLRAFRNFNAWEERFREESEKHEKDKNDQG
jgi:hypothetical protein